MSAHLQRSFYFKSNPTLSKKTVPTSKKRSPLTEYPLYTAISLFELEDILNQDFRERSTIEKMIQLRKNAREITENY